MRDLKQKIEIMSKESKFKSVRGLILFILLLLGHSVSNATTITGYLRDVSGAPYSAARVEFQPISAPSYSNNAVYIGISKSVAAPRGEISVGLVGGWYQTFFHPTTNQITIYVPTTGSYSLAQVATNLANVQNPYGYTPGTNIVFETNTSSGLISINSSGGGSGTTYTNNTSLPGVIVGSGIGTNLATVALKSDATNAAFGALIANNVITNGRTTSATIGGVVLSGTGIVTANSFVGDGSSLTGVGVSASEVAAIMATNSAAGATNQYGSIWLWRNGAATNYASITQAVAVATSGDMLELGTGYYLLTNRLVLPTNFTVRGAGAATVIANGYTNAINVGNSTPLIPLRDNLILENFSTTNIYPARYQCFVGSFAVDGDVCFTNALLRNITGTHNVDWYYVLQTNNCSIRFENVHIRANWDAWFCDNTTGRVTNTVVNSSFILTGPNQLSPSSKARAMLVGRGCSVYAYNSSWIADQSGSTGLLLINSDAFVRMVNCNVVGIGGTNVFNQFGSASDVTFYGSYPSFDASYGSAGAVGTPPWDAFKVENQTVLATNIIVPINEGFVIKSGDEFSPADTTMDVTGNWGFPANLEVGGVITGIGTGITGLKTNNTTHGASGNGAFAMTNSPTIRNPTITVAILGTPAANAINFTNLAVGQTTIALGGTGGTNVTFDASLAGVNTNVFYLSLTTNAYFLQPTNLQAGKQFMIHLRQDSVGKRTVLFNTNFWKFPSAQVLTVTTNASAWSILSCVTDPFGTNVAVIQTLDLR